MRDNSSPRGRTQSSSPVTCREQYTRHGGRRSFGYFCQRSTFHGLADVYRAPNTTLRVFWLVTFAGALGASVYGCYAILHQYLEAPVVASYFIQEAPARFALPDLIVCPFNRFNADFLKRYNISTEVAQYMQLTFGPSAKHPAQRRELNLTIANPAIMAELDAETNVTLTRLNMTFGQFLDAASLKCSDLFIDCVKPTGKFHCCENATDVMTFAGKCYRIGGVDQLGPGYGYGMSVVVSLPKALYSLALNNWLNDGVVLKLAERDQGVDYDLTFVPVGTHALMPLKATKYEFMNDPPRFECLEQAESNYSRVDCFDTCFMEAAQHACQCVIVTNMKKNSLPACSTSQFYFCIYRKLREQFSKEKDTEGYFYRCRQRCTPRCTYHQYTSLISYSKFPSEHARAFTVSETEWTRMKNTIIIDIYYEKLEFTIIKHYRAMTIHGFIANLGGQYSLWLGGSILTLVQLTVFVVNYVFWKCFYGRIGKTSSKNHQLHQQQSPPLAAIDLTLDRRRSSLEINGRNGNGNGNNDYHLHRGRRSISPSEHRRRIDEPRDFGQQHASSLSNGMYVCGGGEPLAADLVFVPKNDSRNRSIFKRSNAALPSTYCDSPYSNYGHESAF